MSLACKNKHYELFLCSLYYLALEARQGKLPHSFVASEEETEVQDRGSDLRSVAVAALAGDEEVGWIPRPLSSWI